MIIVGDALHQLSSMNSNVFDALVTDPPAGIGFMGKDWDGDKGGREQWVAWAAEVFRECLRVMKPGAHGLVWALPRTSHWTATALELAGFEIRDRVSHLFGTGFPKSLDVSKAIDKAAGARREVLAERVKRAGDMRGGSFDKGGDYADITLQVTAPATDDAKRWAGFGTALKPACEDWWLVRKPLSEKTVAANVLRWGTGALNIDASRIGTELVERGRAGRGIKEAGRYGEIGATGIMPPSTGRFPSHLLLSHSKDCVELGVRKVKAEGGATIRRKGSHFGGDGGGSVGKKARNADGTEYVFAWQCADGCAVRELDSQSGASVSRGKTVRGGGGRNGRFGPIAAQGEVATPADSGGASRFFYCAKASRADRNSGCEGMPQKAWKDQGFRDNATTHLSPRAGAGRSSSNANHHPTVKSTELMRYLCRLVTPPGGRILDPFAGSGSTGVAALGEGFEFTGIEQNPVYAEIARSRIAECSPP